MHKINILVDSYLWRKNLPSTKKNIKNILIKSIKSQNFFQNLQVEINVLLTNSKKMEYLNQKFRKVKKDTDILSFPSLKNIKFAKTKEKKKIYLGDLAVSYNYIKKKDVIFKDYLNKILIHGFLHLIGHKHDTESSYFKMEKEHKKITKKL